MAYNTPFMGTKLQPRNGIAAGLVAGVGMIVIWIVSSFIVTGWFNDLILSYCRTWWGLLTFLTFGLTLGVYANRRGAPAPVFSS